MKVARKEAYLALVIALLSLQAAADTLHLKSGEEIKGIVVEEYQDRVIISTYEGEKTIGKIKIERTTFDMPEQNLVSLGDALLAKKEYLRAYSFFSRALKMNPDYAPAREKLDYVTGYMFRKKEIDKMNDIKRVEEITEGAKAPQVSDALVIRLRDEFGASLEESKGAIKLREVIKGSPADRAGLQEGDTIVSIWGKLAGYMMEEDVARMILNDSPGEIRMVIERDISVRKVSRRGNYAELIGAAMDILFDGLTMVEIKKGGAADKAGLIVEDLITKIDGQSTRYMPFKRVVYLVENGPERSIDFTIQRQITIWRG